jgi:ribosomal protein L35AE/L33A
MIIEYRRDHEARRITVVSGPTLNVVDLLEVVNRQAAESLWHYDVLYDERQTSTLLSGDDFRVVVAQVDLLTRTHGRRGRVAIVSRSVGEYGLARMYSILAETVELDSDVFHDLESAQAWLENRAIV